MGGTDLISSLDAMFLDLEEGGVHMHVTVLLIFDSAGLRGPDGALDVDRLRAYLADSVAAAPHFRQRVAAVPVLQSPIWVEAPDLDLDWHIRRRRLDPPGDDAALRRLVGAISGERLPRGRPLWELTIVEGLTEGRFALVFKIHHVVLDGRAGVEAMASLFGLAPAPRRRAAPAGQGAWGLLRRELGHRVGAARELGRTFARTVERGGAGALRGLAEGLVGMVAGGLRGASPTPLNPLHVGPDRAVAWTSIPLAEARARRVDGATVNDVLLAAVTGMVRGYLGDRGLGFSGLRLRATVPVAAERTDGRTNTTVAVLAPLPVDEASPAGRLRRVAAAMRALKRSHQGDAMDLIGRVSDVVTPRLLAAGLKAAIRRRPATLVVSNIVGPPVELSLLGARLLAIYPFVPLNDTQALTLAFISYNGALYAGFHADPAAVDDLGELPARLADALAELPAAATG